MNNHNFPYSDFYDGLSSTYAAASFGGGDDFYGSSNFQGASSSQYAAAATASTSYSDSDDDNLMPWENHGWVPRNKSGKQKTPNMVNSYVFLHIHMTHLCCAYG